MFGKRLLSGIVLIVIALVTIIISGPLLLTVLLLISLIGLHELYRATGVCDTLFSPLSVAGSIGTVLYYIVLYAKINARFMLPALLVGMILIMFVYVFTWPRYTSEQVFSAGFGLLYVPAMLSYIYQTRVLPHGAFTVWLIFLSAWGCDTCAYCVGMLIGRHKMSPKLSPKKSIEGAVGGVVGAALLGALYAWVISSRTGQKDIVIWHYALICVGGALISMVGDLAASAIKRNHEIKDYGNLIPGHGGILDRFDSVIFTAPVIYLLSSFLIR